MGFAWEAESLGPEGTVRVGEALGACLEAGDVVALYGPVGSGKTTFVRGLARGLGAAESEVVSPTFIYVREIGGGRVPLYHVDAYRLTAWPGGDAGAAGPGVEALAGELGIDWYLSSGRGVVAVEWPEPLEALLPEARFEVRFAFGAAPDARRITLEGRGQRAARTVEDLARRLGWAPVGWP